ncbi:MAG: cytochrome c oxidase subunit II [Flavobacteriales bacterium]|nr:cytochrome c oxidase subunit II [Flavobacteriales bacterium]
MASFLIFLVIVLGIAAIVQVIRVFEISNFLQGEDGISVSPRETNSLRISLVLFVAGFFAFFIYLWVAYKQYFLPESASEHGAAIDTLLNFNFLIITIVFVITHILLAYFSYRYANTVSPKATFVTHNNKLELIWTSAPAVVLAIIIIYGLTTWNSAMLDTPDDSINIELYARQFDWTARYAGEDNVLGKSNYLMISATNPLGIINETKLKERLSEMDAEAAELEASRAEVYPGGKTDMEILDKIALKKKQKGRLEQMYAQGENEDYSVADDDILTKVEFHIPVGKPVNFQIRSQDVIHSAFMPHFRAQMNAVPGMITNFYFTPIITTDEMRKKVGDPNFNYLLLCNKICGTAHYNMQMNIIVESEADYQKWLSEQKKFFVAGTN